MPNRDMIVIGTSAGGVETLIQFSKLLPANLPVAIFITTHIPSTTPSVLPQILSRAGLLPAVHPKDGESIQMGKIYIAPSDYHLEISTGHLHLSHGPIENGYRPSIDFMFRNAAKAYGSRVIGIVLSGMLSDGTLGLQAIHEAGGMTIVQDPEEALFPSMPQSALRSARVDSVLPLAGIAQEIIHQVSKAVELKTTPPPPKNNPVSTIDPDPIDSATSDLRAFRNGKDNSPRTLLTCPACGGVLWELHEGHQLLYYCQTGHRYSIESVFGEQTKGVESALWAAVRSLEERAALIYRLAEKSEEMGMHSSYNQFLLAAEKADQDAQVIRQILENSKWTVEANGHDNEGENGRDETY